MVKEKLRSDGGILKLPRSGFVQRLGKYEVIHYNIKSDHFILSLLDEVAERAP